MSKANEMILSLNEDTFSALKKDFDDVLNRTIGNMQMKGASDATITLKLDIAITKGIVNIDGVNRDYNKPSFKHQVNSVLQIKDKATGQLAGEMVLEWDDDAEKFVLRRVDDGQTSIFDDGPATMISPMSKGSRSLRRTMKTMRHTTPRAKMLLT